MNIQSIRLRDYQKAAGAVVVIDVIRAFTTAAFAFDGGAREILLVATVEEALALRTRLPGAAVMGEVGGLPPPGFDFGNSPAAMSRADVRGKRLIQRTGSGTQGAVRCQDARLLLAASFVCAGATVNYLRRSGHQAVTLVPTAHDSADEDIACADFMADRLDGQTPEAAPFTTRVRRCEATAAFYDPSRPDFDPEDIELCAQVDRFSFAMVIERQDSLLVMRPV